MTNPTLVEFVKTLPVRDMRSAIRCVVVYDRCNHDPDIFCNELMGLMQWERKSPLKFLYEMSSLYDQTESVALVSCYALRYFCLMFQDPGMIWPGYTEEAFLNEFVEILNRSDCTLEWMVRIDAVLINILDLVGLALKSVLQRLRTAFLNSSFQECVSPLGLIQKLFIMKSMRKAFCDDPKCQIVLLELFQKGLLPQAIMGNVARPPNPEYVNLYGTRPLEEMQSGALSHIDTLYDVYYGTLAKIINMLLVDGKDTVLAFVQAVIEESYAAQTRGSLDMGRALLATNVESVLIRITLEHLRLDQIDPLTPYLPGSVKIFVSDHGPLAVPGIKSWISEENRDRFIHEDTEKLNEEWQSILQQPHKEPTLISQLFFASVMMMKTTVCFFKKTFENLMRTIMRLISPEQKKALEYEASFFRWAYCYHKKKDQMIRMVTNVIDFMLLTGKYSRAAKVFETEIPPVFYQRLPEALGEVASTVLVWLLEMNMLPSYPEFIDRLSALFSNPHYLPNPNMRKQIVHFFQIIAKKPSETARYVLTSTVLQQVYPAVVNFYSQVQTTGTSTQWYERDGIRLECVRLLRFWFKFNEPKEFYKKNFSSEENSHFLFFLVSDTTNFLGKVVDAFMHSDNDDEPWDEDLQYGVRYGRQWLNLLDSISCFAPEAFSDECLVGDVAKLILYYFVSYTSYASMHVDSIWEKATPKRNVGKFDFLVQLAGIAFHLSGNEALVKAMVCKDFRYTDGLFERISQELYQNPKLSSDFFRMFQDFIAKTNAYRYEEQVESYVDIPDEFQDPVTLELIQDPWQLPTGTNIGRETLQRLQVNNLVDPFTQEPFRMEDAKPNPELKARVDAWIEEQRRLKANH